MSIEPINYDNSLLSEEQMQVFVKGQFMYVKDTQSRILLVNAWNAITQLELWNYMKKDVESYMFCNDKEISIITRKMEELGYDGHSGFSFGWTMRQMQYIAQYGEEQFSTYY